MRPGIGRNASCAVGDSWEMWFNAYIRFPAIQCIKHDDSVKTMPGDLSVLFPSPPQVLTYHGFYDNNLDWVGLEGVQVVASMNAGSTLGRHQLSTRFTSIVRICCIG